MTKLTSQLRAIAVALLVGVSGVSANAVTLYLRSTNAKDVTVELGQIRQIVFGESTVTINLNDGSNVQVANSDFKSLRTNQSGTQGNGESAVNDLTVSGSDTWTVYDLKGNRVAKATELVNGKNVTLSSQLTPGVYILKSESKTIKVVVP
jgi:hypothetical protein